MGILSVPNLALSAMLAYYVYIGASPQLCIGVLGGLVLSVGATIYEKIDWVHSETLGVERHLEAVAPMPERD